MRVTGLGKTRATTRGCCRGAHRKHEVLSKDAFRIVFRKAR